MRGMFLVCSQFCFVPSLFSVSAHKKCRQSALFPLFCVCEAVSQVGSESIHIIFVNVEQWEQWEQEEESTTYLRSEKAIDPCNGEYSSRSRSTNLSSKPRRSGFPNPYENSLNWPGISITSGHGKAGSISDVAKLLLRPPSHRTVGQAGTIAMSLPRH